MSSFAFKKLRVTIALGQKGLNFDDKNNTIVAENLRVSATIQSGNGAIQPNAKIMIYGLSQNVMNRIAKISWNIKQEKLNSIKLEASSDGGQTYTTVYFGTITFAYPNYGSAPEVILTVDSVTAMNHQILPAKPLSFKGEVDVASAISEICKSMDMRFENSGVTAKVSNPYLPQTALDQIKKLCEAVDATMVVELDTIAIAPRGKPRKIKVPIISPQTGLIGYPTPTLQGISLQCLFDPLIKHNGQIEVRNSLIESTNGQWRIYGLTHYLESEIAGGRWFSAIDASRLDAGVKIAK
ncbi:baseplate hub protein [Glaesserella parasuis]|uniref:baseplate hub protein n=1 Tax=Glaesserella parasuis TaxID=738 RepID=UPI0024369AB3|nr:hypothetical protein [Glaesserella parasuis]MDG6346404.1 hypothetical protein [Glaesserella parasuis]